jgi:hypothetical protein
MQFKEYKNLRYNEDFTLCIGPTNADVKDIEFHPNTKIIEYGAFLHCQNIKNVVLSDDIEIIRDKAFSITNIEKFVSSKNLKKIGERAFQYNHYLNFVDFSKSKNLTELGSYAFVDTFNLEKIILPPNLEKINSSCFNHSGFSNITIPETVNFIEPFAFFQCNELKSIDLSKCNKLDVINESTFELCSSLENINLPKNIKTIEYCSFASVPVQAIVLPKSVTVLGESCFESCNKLESINLENVKIINERCFRDCVNLKNINLENCISIYSEAFKNCESLKKIDIPENTLLSDKAFANCKNLKVLLNTKNKAQLNSVSSNKNIEIIPKDLDYYIDKGKSFKEINSILKDIER